MPTVTMRQMNRQLSQVLRQLDATGEAVVITERGVPKYKVIPYSADQGGGRMAELITLGDLAPATAESIDWDQIERYGARQYTTEQVGELARWAKDGR